MAGSIAAGSALVPFRLAASAIKKAQALEPWTLGQLDIHHINTGRGNATFVLAPDGTSMLIDCGASNSSLEETAPPRPDGSRTPGAWVAEYIRRFAPQVVDRGLDYLVATHIHPDHVGDVPEGASANAQGYVPTGLSEVDALVPAHTVIDRSYPDFADHPFIDAPFGNNYIAWLEARREAGRNVEAVNVGSDRQMSLRYASSYPDFAIRPVAGNGRVWTGCGVTSRSVLDGAPDGATLNENSLSIALVIRLGSFGYFAGGDLHSDTYDGRQPWQDVETPAARAAGRVEVAMANHHGYFDAVGKASDDLLDPRAYIVPSWHLSHPGQLQMQRMLRAWPGEERRDVFALDLLPQNRQLNRRFVDQLKSTQGHVVVRVQPDGRSYEIAVLDSTREGWPQIASFGPYETRL